MRSQIVRVTGHEQREALVVVVVVVQRQGLAAMVRMEEKDVDGEAEERAVEWSTRLPVGTAVADSDAVEAAEDRDIAGRDTIAV